MDGAARGDVLLRIARATIARDLGRDHPEPAEAEWLREPGACFVTLRQADRLRGCIGTLEAHRPLIDDVRANARGAAFRDPRFPPLARHELEQTHVEISLLSRLERIEHESESHALALLRPGVDGVIFEYGYHKSTYLPQVWLDLPDPAEFMMTLKQKAGLPPDFWDPAVKLARYTVSKWCEDANGAD